MPAAQHSRIKQNSGVLLRCFAFHVEHRYQYAGKNDQYRADDGSQTHRLMEHQYADYDTGGGLQCAEYGAALAADDKGRLLEKNHSARGHKEGKHYAQQPAPEA